MHQKQKQADVWNTSHEAHDHQITFTRPMLSQLAPIAGLTRTSGTTGSLTHSEPDLGLDFAVRAKHLVLSILAFGSG